MGAEDDPMAVTDTQGRVRNVAGLRAVDASLFPVVPRADTNFPTLMTAEKIADAMLRRGVTPSVRRALAPMMHKSHFSSASAGSAASPLSLRSTNGAYRLVQMTRVGRANEGNGNCCLAKAERQSRRHRRLVRFKIAGEDLPGDHYRATFGGALQINE